MNRTPVESSNLKSVGYDPATKTLEVEFHGGNVHQYAGVGQEHHAGLLTARSPGMYFGSHIREKFRSKKMKG